MKIRLLLLLAFCPAICSAGYSPTKTEINLGPISIDNYFATNGGQIPSCPSNFTVQQCIIYLFNSNPSVFPYTPNNHTAQGVTGVRFQFALRAVGSSTAWDGSGNVQFGWT
jgi:hypothetical protein